MVSHRHSAALQEAAGAAQSTGPMPVVRAIRAEDVEASARAAFAAHADVSARHGYPSEHPTPVFSKGLIAAKLNDPNACGFVAELADRILGSVFLNVFPSASVAVVGPLTVDPAVEVSGVGRALMDAALAEARRCGIARVRLVQSPTHLRSLALYSKLGFEVREPLVLVRSGTPKPSAHERAVRSAGAEDVYYCDQLCLRILGIARTDEVRAALAQQTLSVVVWDGLITGYTTGIGFRGHAVGETSEDLMALIAATPTVSGPGFFVPSRDGRLLRWLFGHGYQAVWQAALMSTGPYQEPEGAFLPSIAF